MLIRNRGQEACSVLINNSVNKVKSEEEKSREDARKYEEIIRQTRIRLELEAI